MYGLLFLNQWYSCDLGLQASFGWKCEHLQLQPPDLQPNGPVRQHYDVADLREWEYRNVLRARKAKWTDGLQLRGDGQRWRWCRIGFGHGFNLHHRTEQLLVFGERNRCWW